ncbi:MAG: hypothetical protein ACFE0Q_12365 [Anaerolineae bacterium]
MKALPMQQLDTLWKMITVAGNVRDLAQERKTYQFTVQPPTTLYLHTEHAVVQVRRWHHPKIEVRTILDVRFGWRMVTDQDEAGVYVIAKRRTVVGSMARGEFTIHVPIDTHLILKIEHGALLLDNLNATLHVPPPIGGETVYLESGKI